MSFILTHFDNQQLTAQTVSEIIATNPKTAAYGLTLTKHQAQELVKTRTAALQQFGRIEFGSGIIGKLIAVFCDSPYLSPDNYEAVLHELIEMFYYYKNETLDQIGDDELLAAMKKAFDGVCRGNLELLKYRELERLAQNVRSGRDPDYDEQQEDRQQQLEKEAQENEQYR